VAGTLFHTELTRTVDFDFNYSFQIVNEESGTYSHHFVPSFEIDLTDDWLDFRVSFVWDRIQDPQPNADGTVPKQDDFYLILSLGLDL
jgi:hypothetical protein